MIPGLRPWEVLSVEQAMDQITYGGEWYREPLGSYTTGPPYIQEWNKDVMVCTCLKIVIIVGFSCRCGNGVFLNNVIWKEQIYRTML